MSIVATDIIDYKSSATDSDGGAISATKVAETQLAVATVATDTVLSVYDAAPFTAADVLVLDNDSTVTEVTVQSINTGVTPNTITLTGQVGVIYAQYVPLGKKENLFPNVTAAQSTSGLTTYRKFYRKNAHATIPWTNPVSYIPNQFEQAVLSVGFGVDHADDTDGAQGNMVALSGNDTIEVLSDGADTRVVTVTGITAAGAAASENLTLNGTTPVVSSNTYAKVLRCYVASLSASRIVTIRKNTGDTTIGTIGLNKKACWLWFGRKITTGSAADAEGGNIADYAGGILFADIAATSNIPYWCRYMCAAGSSGAGNSTAVVATKGETT